MIVLRLCAFLFSIKPRMTQKAIQSQQSICVAIRRVHFFERLKAGGYYRPVGDHRLAVEGVLVLDARDHEASRTTHA